MATPKLRFKEFDGDWDGLKIKDLVKSLDAGVSVNSEDIQPESDQYSVLKTSCISSGYFEEGERKRVLLKVEIERLKERVLDDSILMSRMNTPLLVGRNAYVLKAPAKTFLPDRLWQLKVNKDRAVTRWLAFYLGSDQGLNQIRDLASGTSDSMKNITKPDVMNLNLFAPSKEEQTKIASFLSAVDEKISQLTQKHELLSQYKQGMMQKLFSQQIRFKADDGSEFGEWRNYKLKDIADIYDGTHQTPNYVEQGVPFYSVEHVTANDFSNTKFIAEDVYQAELKRISLQKGDILMTRIGDIGTSRLIDWDVRASFYVSLALIKIKNEDNSSFIDQYIKSQNFQRELHERTIHVAFPKKINLGEIGLCMIELPCLEEQTKIANFLSAIDQKIEKVVKQIEETKQWKKGLLQQMFV
ncbi:restriction endonuclease subunit S [Acinetobacter sp. YH16038]|uniref:restriction endonuclease subunit S n=1 Tax=Acinetobacter sp. YH16038 TaxID=2601183 RepID=UPI0015D1B369|nr:restriction endonuclease subunit S [Acinetobacter sp. YH16038]